ncbi:MAG TPA: Mur ligase family protein [Thermodesulfovibrionales bacterium]|nr:Mur ligase family protein [Thermodesulfovibrionales bacterium]
MTQEKRKLFFSGIGGSGMSAIACFMADKGRIIVGSDRAFDQDPHHPLSGLLRAKGITIVPQDGRGIDRSFDLVVFSTAVEPNRPEVLRARELAIPMKTRPEYLAEIVKAFETIAVAGTSGKSTASGMLAFLMERLGMSPNFIGGGRVRQFRTETNPGNSKAGKSDYLVIEACESDGTIVDYRPHHSIILNLDLDHNPIDRTAEMFRVLMEHTDGMVVINADDAHAGELHAQGVITFSIDNPSDYRAQDIALSPFGTDFSVRGVRYRLSIPGRYNASNALSCIAALSEIGLPPEEIALLLPEFQGIERRFDVHFDDGRRIVIDDYAHNPHKIASLAGAMKNIRERVCYIFQPHGFAPTRMMKAEYIETFIRSLRETDHLVLLPIFYSGGTVAKDISSNDLAVGIRAGGRSVEAVSGRDELLKRVGEWDAYVVFGARDETLSDFAREIARLLRKE